MKRFSMMLLMSVLVAGASGCSCGNGLFGGACSPLGGASLGGFGSNIGSSFGQSQGILPSLQDGPVRRWLRGDACDTCNVPAGQITFDSSFDSSCQSGACNAPIGESVFGVPTPAAPLAAPVTTGYAPTYGELPIESAPADLNLGYPSAPYGSTDLYGGTSDGLVIPPLGN